MVTLKRVMKLMACCVLTAAFMGCATSHQKHETTGQYVDDSVITTKVKKAIFSEESLKSMQISVKTYKGVVQLSGFVDSAHKVKTAGEVARRVEDVVSVENDLLVK